MKKLFLGSVLIFIMTLLVGCDLFGKSTIITFDSEGGTPVQSIEVSNSKAVALPSNPTKDGYKFDGWFVDYQTYQHLFTTDSLVENPAEGNINVYAKWDPNIYNITYHLDGGINGNNPSSYTVQTPSITLSNPIKVGFTFSGWFTNADYTGDPITKISLGTTGDMQLYAKWIVNSYTISFDSGGGSFVDNITKEYGAAVTNPPVPTKVGYTFNGWYSDINLNDSYTFSTMPANNITLYASWLINSYTISFNSNGGSAVASIVDYYNAHVVAPTNPTKDGYAFSGWYTDSDLTNEYTFTTMPAHDITLYASWAANPYTISFNSNGGSAVPNITKDYNAPIMMPLTPVKEGYTFNGWFTDSNLTKSFTFTTMPAENLTLYAKWTINAYTISFDSNGGSSVASITKDFMETISAPKAPTKEGYTFNGWFTNKDLTDQYTFNTMPANNITLYAGWKINIYTITFNSNGGSHVACITTNYNEPIAARDIPTKKGYTFGGWYSDSQLTNLYTFNTMPAKNITLYAKWVVNSYTITYYLGGGINGDNPVTYSSISPTIVLDDATKTGYTFDGWFTASYGGTEVSSIAKGSAENLTLYAHWTINQYTINFDSNDGSSVSAITQNYNTKVEDPHPPTKSGYIFIGWYSDSELTDSYTFSTMPSNNITLYAKWAIINTTTDYQYIEVDNSVTIVSYLGTESDIIIPNTIDGYPVTKIYDYAFYNCNLTSVVIPEGVTSIGPMAFTFNHLTSVTLPSTLITIGHDAFWSNQLTNITLPEGLTSIGDCAFQANQLTSVSLPASLTSIGSAVFSENPNFSSYVIETGNTSFKTVNNSLLSYDGTVLYHYFGSDTNYTIPTGVRKIYKDSFYSTSVTNIVFPASVTEIGHGAFYGTSSLTSVTFEANSQLTTIGGLAFSHSSLTSITIPASVSNIGDGAFSNITLLTNIAVADNNAYYQSVDGVLFNKDLTTLISFPNNYPSVNYEIPNSVKEISNYAFCGVTSLTSVTFEADSQLTNIGSNVFSSSSITSITIPASVTSIDDSAFYGISSLTSVTFEPDSQLTTIGDWAFYGTSLTGITIPASVTTIDAYAFFNIASLTSVTFEVGSQLTTIGAYAFTQTSLTSVSIPASVTTIGVFAFYHNTSLTSVTFETGSRLTTIGDSVFAYSQLSSITIPASVNNIGNGAFSNISSLTSVTFEPDSQLTTIGEGAFEYTSLTGITIPASVTTIDQYAFFYTPSLTSVTFETGSRLTTMGDSAFVYSQLTSITIPASVTTIDVYAFAHTPLTSVTFETGSQLTTIGEGAFEYTSLTGITIPASVTVIENRAFYYILSLTSITFEPNSQLTTIGDSAFLATSITSLTIPASVTTIDDYAFYNIISLISVTFEPGSQLTTIGESAFETTSLTSITIPASVTVIENRAFYYIPSLTSITFEPNSQLTTIGDSAFLAASITSLTIPTSVTTIDDYAFYYIPTLTSINFEDGSQLTTIGDNAFTYNSCTSITIPASVINIGPDAFSFSSITTVTILGDSTRFNDVWTDIGFPLDQKPTE